MRRVAARFRQLLLQTSSGAILLIPTLCLSAWAAAYLVQAYNLALAPGVSINFPYDAPGGKYQVRARSYSIDPYSKELRAYGVELLDPKGRKLITASRIAVHQERSGARRIQAYGVVANVMRLNSGRFDIEDAIPQGPEGGPEDAFDFEGLRVQLHYRDASQPKVPALVAKSSQIRAQGLGDRIMVQTNAAIGKSIHARLDMAFWRRSQYDVSVWTIGADPAELIRSAQPLFGKDPKIPTWKALKLNADARIVGKFGQQPEVFGTATATSPSLSYSGWLDRRVTTVTAKLFGQRATYQAKLKGTGAFLNMEGAMDWSSTFQIGGTGEARIASTQGLEQEIRKLFPRQWSANGVEFKGQFASMKGAQWVDGQISASRIFGPDLMLKNVGGSITSDFKGLQWRQAEAEYQGFRLAGFAEFDFQKNQVLASLESKQVNLAQVARIYKIAGLSGRANLQMIAKGSTSKPLLSIKSTGAASYRFDKTRPAATGFFELFAAGNPEALRIDRGYFKTNQGSLLAMGTLELRKRTQDIVFRASDVPLRMVNNDLKGTGFVSGTIKGTFSKPAVSAEAEAYRVQFGEVIAPYARIQGNLKNDLVEIKNLEVFQAFSKAHASGTWNQRTGRIQGHFGSPGIQLAEFGNGKTVGALEILNGRFGGTLNDPTYSADVRGQGINIDSFMAKEVSAKVQGTKSYFDLLNLNAKVEDGDKTGSIDAKGRYEFDKERLALEGKWDGVSLGPIARLDTRYTVRGQTAGSGKVIIEKGAVDSGTAEVQVGDLEVNGDILGSGTISLIANRGKVRASGSVGSIDRFVALDSVEHDLGTGRGSSSLTAYNVRLEKISALVQPILKEAPEDLRRSIADAKGNLGGIAQLIWDKDKVDFNIQNGEVRELAFTGTSAGDVLFSASKQGDTYEIQKLDWTAKLASPDEPPSVATLSAKFTEKEIISMDGEVRNFPFPWLVNIRPELKPIPAKLDQATFVVSGPFDNLLGRGSARIVSMPREGQTETASLSFDDIEFKGRKIAATGNFQASGFTGSAQFSSSLNAFQPADQRSANDTFLFTAKANQRSLQEFQTLFPGLDYTQSQGTLSAEIKATGSVDEINVSGSASFLADRLVGKGFKTELRDTTLTLNSDGKAVGIEFNLNSLLGGNISGSLTAPLDLSFDQTLEELLARTPVNGRISSEAFVVNEGDESKGNLARILFGDSNLTITGSLAEPLIQGKITLQNTNADIPQIQPGGDPLPPTAIEPRFDIEIQSGNPATLRSINSSFVADGSGKLTGTLHAPNFIGNFGLERGILRLPNARVRLDKGGNVGIVVRSFANGAMETQVPVNLTGRTSVTVQRPGNRYERYDITLVVTGDLADPNGALAIQATSSPGDLTESEILSIIGQRELFESLASLARDSRSNELQNLLLSYALPSLIDPFTSGISDSLGFDYLNLEYNPFEGPTLAVAKSLNSNLTLQGRRQFPLAGYTADQYEWKLVYRIPSRNAFLSRSRLSLINASRRPWRIAFEYSFRF